MVTMRELQIVLDGSARRDERQAWLAAQYAAFAYHSPNEMPRDPLTESVSAPAPRPVADEIREIRRRVKLDHDTKMARRRHGR